MTNKILLSNLIKEATLQSNPMIRPRGGIIEVAYESNMTKFNVNDYITQSKKSRRSEKLETKDKPILQYTMVGRCLNFRKNGVSTSFIIRNILDLVSYEMTFSLYSPFLKLFFIRYYSRTNIKYTRAHQYYLRKHSPVQSLIPFDYVVTYTDEINNLS